VVLAVVVLDAEHAVQPAVETLAENEHNKNENRGETGQCVGADASRLAEDVTVEPDRGAKHHGNDHA